MIQGNRIRSSDQWTTRDGRRLRLHEMDDQHIKNTARMLLRQGRSIHNCPVLYGLVNEMCRRRLNI